ncbi:hypothetical protein ACWDU0_32725 [Streptomyces cellulosae]
MFDGQPVSEPPHGAVGVVEESGEPPAGCPAQDLLEQLDAEGATVAAADAQDQRREVNSGAPVHGLAQQLPGALTHRFGPVGAADHDQRQQTGAARRPAHRRLADPPVPVAQGEREPGLAQVRQIGGERVGVLPLRQEPRPVPGHLPHCRVQHKPVTGVGDNQRVPQRRTSRQAHRYRCPVTEVLTHPRPRSPGPAGDRRARGARGSREIPLVNLP